MATETPPEIEEKSKKEDGEAFRSFEKKRPKKSGREWISEFWQSYKAFTELPSGAEGPYKFCGIIAYLIGLVITLITVYLIYVETGNSVQIGYETEAGDLFTAPPHRYPDIVVCPSYTKNQSSPFAIYYSGEIKALLNMEPEERDELAEIYYQGCKKDTGCKEIPGMCTGKFEKYCSKLDKMLDRAKNWTDQGNDWQYFPEFKTREYSSQYGEFSLLSACFPCTLSLLEALYKERESQKGWTLQMLWATIVSPRYFSAKMYSKHNESFALSDSNLDMYLMKNEIVHPPKALDNVWVGKAFCAVLLGSRMPNLKSGFGGLWAPYRTGGPFRYWFGSLETMELKESSMVSNRAPYKAEGPYVIQPIVSAVVHYQMIRVKDESLEKPRCVEQPILRGLVIPCLTEKQLTSWYYDLSYEARHLMTVWIYAKTLQKIHRKLRYNTYSRLQLAAGVFGLVIGISIMQIVELITALLRKRDVLKKQIITGIEVGAVAILIGATIYLTQRDIQDYVQDRYSAVFIEKEVDVAIPVIKFCADSRRGKVRVLPVNVTKMYEYGVSVNLYAFWQKMLHHYTKPSLPMPYIAINKTGNISIQEEHTWKVPDWMVKNWMTPNRHQVTCVPEPVCMLDDIDDSPIHGALYFNRNHEVNKDKAQQAMKLLKDETMSLAKKIGLSLDRIEIIDFKEFFNLDPNIIIKRCMLWGKEIQDCGRNFGKFHFEGPTTEQCLSVEVRKEEITWTPKLGFRNGLEIVLDTRGYQRDSDLQGYFGPGTEQKNLPYVATVSVYTGFIPQQYHVDNFYHDYNGTRYLRRAIRERDAYGILKIAHPAWQNDEFELPITWNNFERDGFGINVEMRPGFNSMIERVDGNNSKVCIDSSELKCQYPKSEVGAVARAIATQGICGCSMCVEKRPKWNRNLERVLGEKPKCCTVVEFFECQEKLVEKMFWNKTNSKYESSDPRDVINLDTLVYVDLSFASEMVGRLEGNKREALSKLLYKTKHTLDDLDDEVIKRLYEFVSECFTRVCEKETIELVAAQHLGVSDPENDAARARTNEMAPEGSEAVYRFFYTSPAAVGLAEIDRLDATQIFAVVVCGYGVTFGLSFLGIGELLLVVTRKLRGKITQALLKVLHQHLLRSLGVLIDVKAIYEIEDSESSGTKHTSKVSPMESEKEAESDEDPQPNNQSRVHKEELRKQSMLMVPYLFILFVSVIIVTWFFFFKYGNEANDLVITNSPVYQKPSVMICASSPNSFRNLKFFMKQAHCSVSGGKKMACSQVFMTYTRYHKEKYCLLKDNSNELSKLDVAIPDIDMTYDNQQSRPVFTVWLGSLNETRPDLIYPLVEWKYKHDFSLSYVMSIRKTHKSCFTEITSQKCPECDEYPEEKEPPHTCCFVPNAIAPKFTSDRMCQTSRFDTSLLPKKNSNGALGKFTVLAGGSNVFVNEAYPLYGWSMLFSIVGGYVSSFIELSVLNLVCAVLFFGMKTFLNRTS